MAMTFKSPIRKVDGIVDINFFCFSGDDNAVSIVNYSKNAETNALEKVSTTNRGQPQNLTRQIFETRLVIDKKAATFDSVRGSNRGIPLDGSAYLLGDKTLAGWIGDSLSDEYGYFRKGNNPEPQIIALNYIAPRRLPGIEVRGVRIRKKLDCEEGYPQFYEEEHYPVKFRITVFFNDNEPPFVCDKFYGEEGETNDQLEYKIDLDHLRGEDGQSRRAIGAKLEIFKWSLPKVLPRIAYFCGEKHEGFYGKDLQSIEIIEEKTGTLDRLSYGISSNSCKVSFLNREGKFHQPFYFSHLRRGRSVVPLVKCGEERFPLGMYFSEEWALRADSKFMTCTAYDVLYSLQDIEVNIGLDRSKAGERGLPIHPYRDRGIEWVIGRVIEAVNRIRIDNGIFERIEPRINLSRRSRKIKIPYVLINKKSAWEILQEVAEFACAYVFCDREGRVVIQEDFSLPEWSRPIEVPVCEECGFAECRCGIVECKWCGKEECNCCRWCGKDECYCCRLCGKEGGKDGCDCLSLFSPKCEWCGRVECLCGADNPGRPWMDRPPIDDPRVPVNPPMIPPPIALPPPSWNNPITMGGGGGNNWGGGGGFTTFSGAGIGIERAERIALEELNQLVLRGTDGNIVFVGDEPVLDPRRVRELDPELIALLGLEPRHVADDIWWRAIEDRPARDIERMLTHDPDMLPRLNPDVEVTGDDGKEVDDVNDALAQQPPPPPPEIVPPDPRDLLPRIDADNAFRMSIPVKSNTIVNKVNVSYYELVEDPTDPQGDLIRVRREDCDEIRRIGDTNRFEVLVTVRLQKVYDSIDRITATDFTFIRVHEATANSLTLIFERTGNVFPEIPVRINPPLPQ